ncbi:2-oxoacid:acceptor oxidoreductase family protein [Helicovermis profundi]|uniref:Pyruvate synthase subunit PorC n=1 Tax=Helicovermis profundi TaxID=3065157 RepID=A0AAU9DZW3_9FIRM|nr:pyruvate synthase subunit PorC [Clostridia bacterium S502]
MYEVRWHGRGGQGSFTIAKILGMAASVYEGKYAQAFPSFGPERRGAPVLGFTRIDEKKITDRSEIEKCDFAVILDESLWGDSVINGLKENAIIIINTDNVEKYKSKINNKIIGIDATKLALETLGMPITNTAMMGALIGVSSMISPENCKKAIDKTLKPKIAEKNKLLFDQAYKIAKESYNE